MSSRPPEPTGRLALLQGSRGVSFRNLRFDKRVAEKDNPVSHRNSTVVSENPYRPEISDDTRQVLGKIVPLVGENTSEISVSKWSKLLSPNGVSVAALRQLNIDVLKNRRAHGIQLVLAVRELQYEDGTLVPKGTTIFVIHNKGSRWKGKTAYANGKVLRFRKQHVKEKPRKCWTIEDYCEHVVKAQVRDSKTFFLDELEDGAVGPEGVGHFVSQARSSTFCSLCDALEQFFIDDNLNECYIWIDLFCANQGLLTFGDTSAEIQAQREEVLKHGLHHIIHTFNGGCLLFMDEWKRPKALSRAWVIWELLGVVMRPETKFAVMLPPNQANNCFDNMLMKHLDMIIEAVMNVDVSRAECGNESDLVYLREQWNGHEDKINSLVRDHIRAWFANLAMSRGQTLFEDLQEQRNSQTFVSKLLDKMKTPLNAKWQDGRLSKTTIFLLSVYNYRRSKVAKLLQGAGLLLRDMGRFSDALPLFQRTLEIQEEVYGLNNQVTSVGLNNLALLLKDLGRYKEALPLFERALQIDRFILGDKHPSTATGMNNLADVLRLMGRFKEAMPLFKKSLKIDEHIHGPSHEYTASGLERLAHLLREMGKYTNAIQLLNRTIEIKVKKYGPEHPSTASAFESQALCYLDMTRYEKALPLFQSSMEVYIKALGPDHDSVGRVKYRLGKLFMATGDFERSRRCLESGLAVLTISLGASHSRIGRVMFSMAKLNLKLGNNEQGLQYLESAKRIYLDSLSEDHPYVLQADQELALLEPNNILRSIKLKQVLERREACLGSDHPDTKTLRELLQLAN